MTDNHQPCTCGHAKYWHKVLGRCAQLGAVDCPCQQFTAQAETNETTDPVHVDTGDVNAWMKSLGFEYDPHGYGNAEYWRIIDGKLDMYATTEQAGFFHEHEQAAVRRAELDARLDELHLMSEAMKVKKPFRRTEDAELFTSYGKARLAELQAEREKL